MWADQLASEEEEQQAAAVEEDPQAVEQRPEWLLKNEYINY